MPNQNYERAVANEPFEECIPPSFERICQRLAVLWANGFRSIIERDEEFEDREETVEDILDWISKVAPNEMTKREVERHSRPVGSWSEKEILDDSWDVEAAVPLAWAVGIVTSMPLWDISTGFEQLRITSEEFPDLRAISKGRIFVSNDDIEQMAQSYEVKYWRIRCIDSATDDKSYCRKLMGRAVDLNQVELAQDGDLSLSNGTSICDATQDEISECTSVSMERLYGLNWLCGQEENWDEVTADTVVGWLWDDKFPKSRPLAKRRFWEEYYDRYFGKGG